MLSAETQETQFLNPSEAREHYNLTPAIESANASEVDKELAEYGIAAVEIPLSSSDFEALSTGYAICLEECPELLRETAHAVDTRRGNEAGHVRKEVKINQRTNLQTADPKNYFHFNELARPRWREQFAAGPQVLRDFLEDGYEIQDTLVRVARRHIADLEPTHPNISSLYFESGISGIKSYTYLRLIRYDGYSPTGVPGEVAKPHYDIGGATIQAYADAPGFWGAKDGPQSQPEYYDTRENEGYLFLGKGHEKIYGKDSRLQPLWHGVDRIIPAGTTWVPDRTAVILFIDAPDVDYNTSHKDTVPYR